MKNVLNSRSQCVSCERGVSPLRKTLIAHPQPDMAFELCLCGEVSFDANKDPSAFEYRLLSWQEERETIVVTECLNTYRSTHPNPRNCSGKPKCTFFLPENKPVVCCHLVEHIENRD